MKRRALGKGLRSLIPEAPPRAPVPIPEGDPRQAASARVLELIDIDLIAPNSKQPRREFDEASLEELADSLKSKGVIQPIVVRPGDDVYEGQIVGIHSRGNDLTVNPLKTKQLTNIRTVLKDENVQLAAFQRMTLEQALEFIEDGELVEVTPESIRLRKECLLEHERKTADRRAKKGDVGPAGDA